MERQRLHANRLSFRRRIELMNSIVAEATGNENHAHRGLMFFEK
jgi:hypothetical protein